MTNTTPKPKKEKAPPAGIDFRCVSGYSYTGRPEYRIALFVQGEQDETIFTLDANEPRDVIARRLTQAFATVFNVAVEMGRTVERNKDKQTPETEDDAQAAQA